MPNETRFTCTNECIEEIESGSSYLNRLIGEIQENIRMRNRDILDERLVWVGPQIDISDFCGTPKKRVLPRVTPLGNILK